MPVSIAMPVPMPSMVHSLHGIQKERGRERRRRRGRKDRYRNEGRVVWAQEMV
jgi:hypothetical protein